MHCNECPVSLVCYAGRLKNMWLCPECGRLYMHCNMCVIALKKSEDILVDKDNEVIGIYCCLRRSTPDIHLQWKQKTTRCSQVAITGIYATILVEDKGPSQAYVPKRWKECGVKKTTHAVQLCTGCLERAMTKIQRDSNADNCVR